MGHQVFATQLIDTFIDGFTHPLREQPNETVARAYAADLSGRRRGEVHVIHGQTRIDMYVEGVAVINQAYETRH